MNRLLVLLSLACFAPGCAAEAEPATSSDEGRDSVLVGEAPPSNNADAAPISVQFASNCTDAQWILAQHHAFNNHSTYSLFGGPSHPTVTSCNYNPQSGYVVYTYAYMYKE